MWGSGGGGMPPPPPNEENENARLALSVLAAYSAGDPSSAITHPSSPPPDAMPSSTGTIHHQHEEEGQVTVHSPHAHHVPPPSNVASSMTSPPHQEEEEKEQYSPPVAPPRGKPEAMAKALGEARLKREQEELKQEELKKEQQEREQHHEEKKKKTPSKKRKRASPKKKHVGPTMDDPVSPISNEQYKQLDQLLEQFCKVPLLAEFSRPVALLHPELLSIYSKIVTHPVDMGKVCRSVRRRSYLSLRDIQLDVWRIFCNCCKYHTHPSNKDRAVPSFCSISLHLRQHFNNLWQEYLLESEYSGKARMVKQAHEKRQSDRIARIKATSATFLSTRALEKTAASIRVFLNNGGRVDDLDAFPLVNEGEDFPEDLNVVVENLQQFQKKVLQIASVSMEQDYTVLEFVNDFRACFEDVDLLQSKPALRIRLHKRLERLIQKVICPIYEANGRGVNQSSIWGCMAAAIWARESSKKQYWPALVLGILAPADQREDWHSSLTSRNEERLPEKLRTELQSGKRKAEQALKRQNQGTAEQQSFFLVEFMGTHEFIWVKEADIIESFDPDEDPNQAVAAGNVTKKKRSSRVSSHDVTKSKTYANAIEEARWALEEFELQLNDTCGDLGEEEEEEEDGGEEQGYSYSVLSQSDDEAEEAEKAEQELTVVDIEESNELLATDGLLDFTVAGRKEAKKRVAARKKLKADAEKKERAEHAKKQKLAAKKKKKSGGGGDKGSKKTQREEKRVERELERKRRKRGRERDRILKDEMRKKKRRRTDVSDKGIPDKRARANAIVKGYLTRLARKENMGSAFVIPASAVDSTGLLGMALAFRAAAGAITLEDQDESFLKPKAYELVDTTSAPTSAERITKLREQLALMEKEKERLKETTAKRKELTEQALQEGEEVYNNTVEQEAQAKKSDVKKRKKYVKGAKKAAADSEKEKAQDQEALLTTDEQLEDEPRPVETQEDQGKLEEEEGSKLPAEEEAVDTYEEAVHAEEEAVDTYDEAVHAEEEAHLRVEEEADFRREELRLELQADKDTPEGFYSADEMEAEEEEPREVAMPQSPVAEPDAPDQFADAD